MERGWFEVLDALVVDPGVRAVVLTGAGRGFCAGLDAEHIARRSAGAEAAPPRTRPLSGLAAFPKPVVAAVNGPAVGLGLALALCCDAGRAEFREGGSALRGRRAPEFPPLGPDHPDVREWLRPVD